MRTLTKALILTLLAPLLQAQDRPVKVIAPQTLTLPGDAKLPLYLSLNGATPDLSHPQPSITRVLIVFHGKARNADTYNQSGLEAIRNAGPTGPATLLITPQFLQQVDADAFHLPANYLRWAPEAWESGENALNAPLSTFAAIDAILALFHDQRLFPNLKTIVLAGHSGGGQIVQRYAVAGNEPDKFAHTSIAVRFIVANPSSYLYFSADRPVLNPTADFTFGAPAKTCHGNYNTWKYGLLDLPPYLNSNAPDELEHRYISRHVTYLLGTQDIDPDQAELDKSCSAELQGPYRFFRGKAYFRYLELRHPGLAHANSPQRLWFVPGVAHDGARMLNSSCGIAALFNTGTCTTTTTAPTP